MTSTHRSFSDAGRIVMRRVKARGTLTFLGFLALAVAFWLAVTLNDTYEVEVAVPLELRDVPSNVVITTELPKELRITLRDKGVRLLPYLYGPKPAPIIVSYKDHQAGKGRGRFTGAELLGQLSRQFSSPTQIVRIKPDTLEFYYNFGASKRVPVRFDGSVRCANGYFVTQTILQPEFVTVYAPSSVLDTLRSVTISPLQIGNVRDTVRSKQPIATLRGMKSVPAEIQVTVITDRLTEKTIRVPIHSLNFPANRVLRTFPSFVDVTFKVGVSQYERIGPERFVIALAYEQLLSMRGNKTEISVRSVPDGVSDVRVSPRTVDFVIETVPEEADSVKEIR